MKRYSYIIIGLAILFSIYLIYKSPNTQETTIAENKSNESTEELDESIKDVQTQNEEEQNTEQVQPEELFSDSNAGKSIKKILELYTELDNPDSDRGKEAHLEIKKLYETPNQSFEEIKKGCLSLPHEMELQKQFLLQFSSMLNVDRAEKLGFLDKAFKDTMYKAGNSVNYQTRKTPIIVFDTYCRTANDKELCFNLINSQIKTAPKDVQISLLNSYKSIDVEKAKELANQNNIQTY